MSSFHLSFQAFRTSLELHCNGKNSFYHNLMKISEYYDLSELDPNNSSEAKIKHYIDTPISIKIASEKNDA